MNYLYINFSYRIYVMWFESLREFEVVMNKLIFDANMLSATNYSFFKSIQLPPSSVFSKSPPAPASGNKEIYISSVTMLMTITIATYSTVIRSQTSSCVQHEVQVELPSLQLLFELAGCGNFGYNIQ